MPPKNYMVTPGLIVSQDANIDIIIMNHTSGSW